MNTNKKYTDPWSSDANARVSDTRYADAPPAATKYSTSRVSDTQYSEPAPVATKYASPRVSDAQYSEPAPVATKYASPRVSDAQYSDPSATGSKPQNTRISDVRYFDSKGSGGEAVQGVSTQQCPDSSGTLPGCAPLAVPYVPFQQRGSLKYNHADALNNGTLYPSLNLPFHLKVNAPNVVSDPLSELQALDFVVHELVLYLDTHPDDTEAFELYRQYAATAQEARRQYEAAYGPLTNSNPGNANRYVWLDDPWPWNLKQSQKGWGK